MSVERLLRMMSYTGQFIACTERKFSKSRSSWLPRNPTLKVRGASSWQCSATQRYCGLNREDASLPGGGKEDINPTRVSQT